MSKPETFSRSFHPPHAVIIWCDEASLYIEVPSKQGPPAIISFRLSEGGLGKALDIMRGARDKSRTKYSPPRRRRSTKFTDEQLDRASSILKKSGMV